MRKRKLFAVLLIFVFAVMSVSSITDAATKAPKKIKLNKTKTVMYVGETLKLKTTVTPSSASKSVKWTSSNKKVATVTSKGKVKALKAGKVVITCTSKANKKIKTKCKITVKKPVKTKSIKFTNINSDGSILMDVGYKYKLKYKMTPSNATYKDVKWKSSDKTVATVDKNGNVTAKSAGTAVVTCYSSKYTKVKAKCTVNVMKPKNVRDDADLLEKTKLILSRTGEPLYGWLHDSDPRSKSDSNGVYIWSTTTNANGTLKYVHAYQPGDFTIIASTYTSASATPYITFDGSPDGAADIRAAVKDGSYDFKNDPEKVILGWNMWAKDETKASLEKMLNCKISDTVYDQLITYRKSQAANYAGGGVMIVYGRNANGVLTGRYAGYYSYNMASNATMYAFIGVASDNEETYGKIFSGNALYN